MTVSSGAVRADSKLTREHIMNAAIRLFAENGYSSTSMRSIASLANVNVAAANYHFGSKRKLFEAAFNHCAAPINIERLRKLDAIETHHATPSVNQIMRAFLDVGIAHNATWARLAARIFVEPKSISRPLLEQVFGPILQRFIKALHKALPDVPHSELEWRFHYVVGAMLQLIRSDAPLHFPNSKAASISTDRQIDSLVDFVVGGLCQQHAPQPKGRAA